MIEIVTSDWHYQYFVFDRTDSTKGKLSSWIRLSFIYTNYLYFKFKIWDKTWWLKILNIQPNQMWGGCLKTQNTLALCSVPCCLEVPKFFFGGGVGGSLWWTNYYHDWIIDWYSLCFELLASFTKCKMQPLCDVCP